LLNVTEAQRPLVAAALLNAFHPHGPYFVTNYVGEQGTAKSCAARIQRQLIDPNENPLRSPPKEERDLMAQAAGNRCVALDNLSSLPSWLSDALCRLATGGGHSARTLYTDLEEISLAVKRPVILNGIEDVATGPILQSAFCKSNWRLSRTKTGFLKRTCGENLMTNGRRYSLGCLTRWYVHFASLHASLCLRYRAWRTRRCGQRLAKPLSDGNPEHSLRPTSKILMRARLHRLKRTQLA